MNPALNPKPFPKNGLAYGELCDGWYVAETKSGDFVAFHVVNQSEFVKPNGYPGFQHEYAEITDHMGDEVYTGSFTQYALLKED